ncbi:hypothetical protein [Flavobacterium sp.]|uniref:hypothetical protein n=1 Tax=Flavobacterium sp. TaxID=239 RepID=UPI00286B974D|nr:hypothetical protein [Flavobacterium sp.]
MSKKTKAFVYQIICFAILFIPLRYIIGMYTGLSGYWIPLTSFVIATIVTPKFQAVRTNEGEKLFVKWLFAKQVKEIK